MTTIEQEEKRFDMLAAKFEKIWDRELNLSIDRTSFSKGITYQVRGFMFDSQVSICWSDDFSTITQAFHDFNDRLEARLNGKVE